MSNFKLFANAIEAQYLLLSKGELFTVKEELSLDVDGDLLLDPLWNTYLNAFPEGTDPIFRERSSHDCSCCKQFLRNIGGVVAIVNGKRVSIWDVEGLEYPYDVVAAAMSAQVHSMTIKSVFRVSEPQYGRRTTRSLEAGVAVTYNHFEAKVGPKHFTKKVGEELGKFNSIFSVFERGLKELTVSALEEVLALDEEKQIYRVEEHVKSLKAFLVLKKAWEKLTTDHERELFLWSNLNNPVARFRNTVIGTLIEDLSSGMSTEKAVKSFETKVAPANYKRTSSPITKGMVEEAMKTLEGLDMKHAFERRFAKLEDVSVNNVLFVNNSAKGRMKGGLEDLLLTEVKTN